jgi:lipid II:glycine glycyltransferase (peptidoglycan interpeptide bridge formation enzyme)
MGNRVGRAADGCATLSAVHPADGGAADLEAGNWDRFVAAHPYGHFLQSAGWGRLREARGAGAHRLWRTDDAGRPALGAQALVERRYGGRIVYVPRGPVSAPDDPALPDLLADLRRLTDAAGALALRLEPPWPDTPATRAVLGTAGFREVEPVQPASTVRLDLRRTEDDLLADMKQKWRYNVRLAGRRGVEVVEGGEAELPTFAALVAITARRDDFSDRGEAYYRQVWQALGPAARLYVARWRDEVLAAIFVVHFGATATYLYGASSDRERQRMPNHILQWEAIRRAKAAGLRWYDFWGVPDALGRAVVAGADPYAIESAEDGLWGVWGFKRGFGGEIVRSVGAWDAVRRPLRYWLGAEVGPQVRRLSGRLRR